MDAGVTGSTRMRSDFSDGRDSTACLHLQFKAVSTGPSDRPETRNGVSVAREQVFATTLLLLIRQLAAPDSRPRHPVSFSSSFCNFRTGGVGGEVQPADWRCARTVKSKLSNYSDRKEAVGVTCHI